MLLRELVSLLSALAATVVTIDNDIGAPMIRYAILWFLKKNFNFIYTYFHFRFSETCKVKPVGWRFPNPGVCDTYLECVPGQQEVLRACAPGTWFDSRTTTCTWPHLSDCVPKQETTTTTSTRSKRHARRRMRANVCHGRSVGYKMHAPHACESYVECVHGYPLLRPCAAGTWFDARTQSCTWPHLSDCRRRATATRTTTTATTARKPGKRTTTTTSRPLNRSLCSDETTRAIYANPKNCATFYECRFGQAVLRACPHGTGFNAEEERCDASRPCPYPSL